jgi:sulfite reductase (NADPH) flavoprotein alpha-component
MAKDVHAELIRIVQTHGGKSPEEARAFVEEDLMKAQKRYRRDVY